MPVDQNDTTTASSVSAPESESLAQDRNFNAFGFSKIARRNLVIGIMVVQFGAIGELFRENAGLHNKIDEIKTAQADSANAQYARLISRFTEQMKPVQAQVDSIQKDNHKTDSLQNKIIKENRLNTK